MHASRKCPAYTNTIFKRGDVKGCIAISTDTDYSTIADTKTIERSSLRPYPTKFDHSRIDHLVGLYDQQPAQRTFKIPYPTKSLHRELLLRHVQRSRQRHEEIISACFDDLTMQCARQALIKQKKKIAMLSLKLRMRI
jgi:hypothetical protein